MKKVLICAAIAALSATAHADWQNTKWGMTVEQVKALYPDAVPYTDHPGSAGLNLKVRNKEPEIIFGIDKTGLAAVILMYSECSGVLDTLFSKYGSPRYTHGREAVWHPDAANMLNYIGLGRESCSVGYFQMGQVPGL